MKWIIRFGTNAFHLLDKCGPALVIQWWTKQRLCPCAAWMTRNMVIVLFHRKHQGNPGGPRTWIPYPWSCDGKQLCPCTFLSSLRLFCYYLLGIRKNVCVDFFLGFGHCIPPELYLTWNFLVNIFIITTTTALQGNLSKKEHCTLCLIKNPAVRYHHPLKGENLRHRDAQGYYIMGIHSGLSNSKASMNNSIVSGDLIHSFIHSFSNELYIKEYLEFCVILLSICWV